MHTYENVTNPKFSFEDKDLVYKWNKKIRRYFKDG